MNYQMTRTDETLKIITLEMAEMLHRNGFCLPCNGGQVVELKFTRLMK